MHRAQSEPTRCAAVCYCIRGWIKETKTIEHPNASTIVKEEPVFAISAKPNKKECWRYGAGKFAASQLKAAKARIESAITAESKSTLNDNVIPKRKFCEEKRQIAKL